MITVVSLFALVIAAKSITATFSPASTVSPTCTLTLNGGRSASSTVSIPRWTNTSRPLFPVKPIACRLAATIVTLPLIGATTCPSVGSIPNPCPIIPCENTGSWTDSSGTNCPATGVNKCTCFIAILPLWLINNRVVNKLISDTGCYKITNNCQSIQWPTVRPS